MGKKTGLAEAPGDFMHEPPAHAPAVHTATSPLLPLPAPVAPAPAERPLRRWRVSLTCPTPLAHREMEIEAADEHAAKAEFCRVNGITDSIHPWKVERI